MIYNIICGLHKICHGKERHKKTAPKSAVSFLKIYPARTVPDDLISYLQMQVGYLLLAL